MIAYSPLGLGVLGGRYRKGGVMPSGARGSVLKDKIIAADLLLGTLDEVPTAFQPLDPANQTVARRAVASMNS